MRGKHNKNLRISRAVSGVGLLRLSGIFLIGGLVAGFSSGQPPAGSPAPFGPDDWNKPAWWDAVSAGNRLWEKRDREGAIIQWQEAVDKGFQDGMVFYHLGMYYHEHEDLERAVRYLGLAKPWLEYREEDQSLKIKAYLALADTYLRLNNYGEAFIHYQKVLRIEPDSPLAHMGLSRLYLFRSELKSAQSEANKVLSLQPDNADAYSVLAQVATREKDYKSSARYYRQALGIEPDLWEARLALAWLLQHRLGEGAEAEKEFKVIIAHTPSSAFAHAALSEIYLRRGKRDLAREEALRTLALEPDNYQGLVILGQLYLQGGEPERARECFQTALEVSPAGAYANYGLGLVALQDDKLELAESRFRQALRSMPDFPEAAYNLGVTLAAAGRSEEAEEKFKSVLEHNPDFVPAQVGLGKLYYLHRDLEKAHPYFKNALALDRNSFEALYFLGKCHYDRGHPREALEYFLKAQEIDSSNAALYTDLGLTYDQVREPELAGQSFRRALQLDPHYLRGLVNLAVHESRWKHEEEAAVLYQQAVIIKPGEISWGYAGEEKNFLEKIVASLEDYLPSGVDYLSVYKIIENISRTGSTFSELIPFLEGKVKSHPFDPRYLHLLGMAYQEVGRMGEAERSYRRALQIDSDFASAHLSLGKLYARQGRSVPARTHLKAFLTLLPDSSLTPVVEVLLKEVGEEEEPER